METRELSKIFKALSHPNRLELYIKLTEQKESTFPSCQGCLISDLITALNIKAPTISHHLKELANANLITTQREGKFLVARVNRELQKTLSQFFSR